MLEAEKKSQKNWNFVIKTVEWSFIVFVFAIQGPDVGGDEVGVILLLVSIEL
jgi:hypothetical protein